nr:MAG TPA: hypothetical protein [Caudoviricetes sp.]
MLRTSNDFVLCKNIIKMPRRSYAFLAFLF